MHLTQRTFIPHILLIPCFTLHKHESQFDQFQNGFCRRCLVHGAEMRKMKGEATYDELRARLFSEGQTLGVGPHFGSGLNECRVDVREDC